MKYRAWQPRTVDRAAAAALAKALAQHLTEQQWALRQEADPDFEPTPAQQAEALSAQTKACSLLAGVLCARGITDPAQAAEMLFEAAPMSDPMQLQDMQAACTRILRAVDTGETIVIFGDYDVDGVTATALLYQQLKGMGADAKCMLPSREGEGYGLSRSALDSIHKKGYKLVVTVDTGISALSEAAYAAELGIELVITDHHLPQQSLPQAVAVVDPNRADDASPCKTLSGAGVAFKLCAALDGYTPEEMLEYCGDLAAVGTVADVMPLTGENRTLVAAGLAMLQDSDRPGIRALLEVAGLSGKPVTADSISYVLAPRINAAGRMDSAVTALQLLLCDSEERAAELAARLNDANTARQQTEQEIAAAVQQQLEADPSRRSDRVVLVWGSGWHPGVIGIAASRLAEQTGRPAVVISIDENGEGRGSGRSRDGFNLHSCIASCADLLIRYGGHAMAAGFSVRQENIPELRRRMNDWALHEYPVLLRRPAEPDLSVCLDRLSMDAVRCLDRLAPFGSGNPQPLFLLENARIEGIFPVSEGKHTRLRLRQGGTALYAVYFGMQPACLPYEAGDTVDVLLTLSLYEARGGSQYSGRIQELRPAGLGNEAAQQAALFEALQSGAALEKQQKEQLLPARADMVRLYRELQAGCWHADDLQPLFARLKDTGAGRILVGITAMEQLGLAAEQDKNGAVMLALLPAAEKKDLSTAPVIRRIEE